jgi:hypothetical protein
MSVIEQERVEERTVTEADVLNRAADLLEEFGWCQAEMGSKGTGSFCAAGAMIEAAHELGYPPRPDETLFGFADRLLFGGSLSHKRTWMFNDAHGRTKAEVVFALRSAAERSQ